MKKEKSRRLKKGSPDDWPSLALMEFTMALAKAMAENDMKQKDLAEALDVSRPYISSVMSGNENLTVEQMSRLAEAAGGSLHLAIAPKGVYIRWVKDTVEELTTEAAISPLLHGCALNVPVEYHIFAPPIEATHSCRLIQGPWANVATQDVSRPAQPPFSLSASRSSSKPLPRRPQTGLLHPSERRIQ